MKLAERLPQDHDARSQHDDVANLQTDLSIRTKNGIPFILAAAIIWSIITFIFMTNVSIEGKNVLILYSTGLMFPLALLFSKLLRADWNTNDSPLGKLGLFLNVAQVMYFPLLVWAFMKSPQAFVLFFAVITGAHFFPYGWLYRAKGYYVMAPVIAVGVLALSLVGVGEAWSIPFVMVVSLAVLALWLFVDYRIKVGIKKSIKVAL